ncbi:MAG: HvfC/BufC family peptide modification chaperone [Sphingopyxis solisilvae]|uniref:HvfC/BufC family peptide modification chaperone n=1 Tax=Sphingopyxis solisilvae TaxID=1886788 RepID=UPI004035AA7F
MREGQAAIAVTLLRGPEHLPADLFAGDSAAVLRGLRVHANTISHARLVALEDSFPRTRDYLGDGEFNRVSRDFLDGGGAQGRSVAKIGAGFPDWLADPLAADLARVEWAWLESYHAADAPALALAELAALDEAALLARVVRCHPATRVVTLSSAAAPLVDPGFARGVRALLVTRPEADVRLLAVDRADVAALAMASERAPLGNLVAHLAELHPNGGGAIAALIPVGAFERV